MHEGKRFNILCLSGGGFRGLYTAAVLEKIEEVFLGGPGKKGNLQSHFDLIIGTSTGGLIATALAFNIPPKKIRERFELDGPSIFPPKTFGSLVKQFLFFPQYSKEPLRRTIRNLLPKGYAQKNIQDLPIPLALVAMSRINQRHRIFTGRQFSDKGTEPVSVEQALLATTAAPTYFEEERIGNDRLIDGGLVANAPVLIGASLLRSKLRIKPENINILHIGTASTHNYQKITTSYKWWPKRILHTTRDLVLHSLSAQEALAIDIGRKWLGERYVYIDAPERLRNGPELETLDDASEEAKARLLYLAEQTWLLWKDNPWLRAFFPIDPPKLDYDIFVPRQDGRNRRASRY